MPSPKSCIQSPPDRKASCHNPISSTCIGLCSFPSGLSIIRKRLLQWGLPLNLFADQFSLKKTCQHKGDRSFFVPGPSFHQPSEEFLNKIWQELDANPKAIIEVNLEKQQVILPDGSSESFDINPYKKACLLNGYDDIDYLLSLKNEITAFENR